MKKLGFIHGENFLDLDRIDLSVLIEMYLKQPSKLQKIAENGRHLVFQNHSASARTSQFSMCIDAILRGEFYGTEWDSGAFVLRDWMST
jgi:spore maturation protein CgeB